LEQFLGAAGIQKSQNDHYRHPCNSDAEHNKGCGDELCEPSISEDDNQQV